MPTDHRALGHEICPNCAGCIECGHCECVSCEACGERYYRVCHHCECCSDCCGCNESGIEHFTHGVKFYTAKPAQVLKSGVPRHTSLEIEVNGVRSNHADIAQVVQKWWGSIVSDGSLNEDGFEINTSPANGDMFYTQILQITEELDAGDAHVGDNCGLHTHVDCRDFTWFDLRKLILVWYAVEPAVYQMVNEHRRENSYCFPLGNRFIQTLRQFKMPHESKLAIMEKIYGTHIIEALRQEKYHSTRYSVMNLHSWVYRKSVEFRLPPGTTRFSKMCGWAETFNAIVEFANKSKEKDLWQMIPQETRYSEARIPECVQVLERVIQHKECKEFMRARMKKYGNYEESYGVALSREDEHIDD